jgi:hypothetical protein
MLSPANHHLLLSRDLKQNLRQRRALLKLAIDNPPVQRRLQQMCREDILFYIKFACWQYDVSKEGALAVAPFITSPRQEELIVARPETHAHLDPYDRGVLYCLENGKTMACEKSRWQGASWLFMFVMGWHCGFHDHRGWICISRDEDAVDDDTANSLFWKLRYVLAHQPDWLMGKVKTPKLYFKFTRTGSEISGEASTAKAGVGGRGSAIFVDEFPEIQHGQQVREKTALTANSRFFVGTHLGAGTPFDQMCDARLSPEIVRQRLHWTDGLDYQRAGLYQADPDSPGMVRFLDKSYRHRSDYPFVLDGSPTGGPMPGVRSPWYDDKAKMIGDPRSVAQNLDIDVAGSAKQFFDPIQVRALVAACRPPVWEGEADFDRQGNLLGMHPERGGRLRLWVPPDGFGNLPAAHYCAGADIAAGTGATNSCFSAIDGGQSLVALEWADPRTDEKQFAALCVALCRWLKDKAGDGAYFGWDSSGQQGARFCIAMAEIGYGNIYYNEDDVIKHTSIRRERRPGWFGGNDQRFNALKDYRNALYDRTLADRSERCLKETLLFEVGKNGEVKHSSETRTNDPTGAKKNHGDMVISRIIAWMLAKELAAGGRRAVYKEEAVLPGSLEWLLKLEEGQRRQLEEAW